MTVNVHLCRSDNRETECSKKLTLRCKYVLIFLVTGKYEGRTEEVVSLAMWMLNLAASNKVPPFLTHTFDEVSVWSFSTLINVFLNVLSNELSRVCNTFWGLIFGNS